MKNIRISQRSEAGSEAMLFAKLVNEVGHYQGMRQIYFATREDELEAYGNPKTGRQRPPAPPAPGQPLTWLGQGDGRVTGHQQTQTRVLN